MISQSFTHVMNQQVGIGMNGLTTQFWKRFVNSGGPGVDVTAVAVRLFEQLFAFDDDRAVMTSTSRDRQCLAIKGHQTKYLARHFWLSTVRFFELFPFGVVSGDHRETTSR